MEQEIRSTFQKTVQRSGRYPLSLALTSAFQDNKSLASKQLPLRSLPYKSRGVRWLIEQEINFGKNCTGGDDTVRLSR
jgi:hypothetical protein